MIKSLLRTWLPLLFAFAIGWAAQVYWLGVPASSAKNAARAHGSAASTGANTPTAFSANHANAIQGKDTEPKLVAWSADSALGKILAANRGGQRELAIAGLVTQTPVEQLGKLIDEARFCTDDEARTALTELAYAKWAALDPAAALAFARTAASKRYDRDTVPLTQVLAVWAGHDPASALAAAQSLDLASFRQQGIRAVLQAWGESDDPQGAVAAAKALGLSNQLNSALSAIFTGWAQRDPAGAFAALASIDNLNTRNSVASAILTTMADQNPKGALDLFQTMTPGAQNANPETVNYIFSRLTMQDPHAAVEALTQVPTGVMHQRAVTCVACDWADADPQGAMAWANSLSNPADRNNALYNAVRHVATSDPILAANDLKLIPDMNQRNQAMNDVLGRWVDTDPAAALKWVQTNTTGTAQTMALSQVVNNIAQIDPMSALNVIQQMPDSPNHNSMVFQTINNWSQSDPEAALNWAKSNLAGNDLITATGIAVRQLINADPAAGAQYVTSLPDGPDRNNFINQVATSMARQDMDGAINWINNLDATGVIRNNAIQNVMGQLSSVDPQLAATKLQTLTFDTSAANSQGAYSSVASQIASNWAATDPAAALAWASTLDGTARVNAMGSAVSTLANSDPAAAWNTVMSLPADDPSRSNLINNVVSSYARQDPATAVNLLGNLNQGQYNNAVSQISSNWIRQDPYAASQWISTLPTSPAKDTAVQNMLNAQGQYDLATSMQWVGTMSTEAAQTRGYTTVIQQAARKDPAAAQAAVNAANLTDAQRQQLTQIIQRATPANGQVQYQGNLDNANLPPGYHIEYGPNGEQRVIHD